MILAEIVNENTGRRILAEINVGGRCKVQEELEGLPENLQDDIAAIMDDWVFKGQKGPDRGRYGVLEHGNPKIEYWAPSKHDRLYWFADGGDIIITKVARKNRQKADPKDRKKAIKAAKSYYNDKKKNDITVIPLGD